MLKEFIIIIILGKDNCIKNMYIVCLFQSSLKY